MVLIRRRPVPDVGRWRGWLYLASTGEPYCASDPDSPEPSWRSIGLPLPDDAGFRLMRSERPPAPAPPRPAADQAPRAPRPSPRRRSRTAAGAAGPPPARPRRPDRSGRGRPGTKAAVADPTAGPPSRARCPAERGYIASAGGTASEGPAFLAGRPVARADRGGCFSFGTPCDDGRRKPEGRGCRCRAR
jgi:hypothetical protein